MQAAGSRYALPCSALHPLPPSLSRTHTHTRMESSIYPLATMKTFLLTENMADGVDVELKQEYENVIEHVGDVFIYRNKARVLRDEMQQMAICGQIDTDLDKYDSISNELIHLSYVFARFDDRVQKLYLAMRQFCEKTDVRYHEKLHECNQWVDALGKTSPKGLVHYLVYYR